MLNVFQQTNVQDIQDYFVVENSFLLTWKCSFMKFCDWFGAIPSFDCNFFASSVLFNLLLDLEERQRLIQIHICMHETAGKAIESAGSNICFGYFHILFNLT